ncbi:MAG: CusA/CzcA family heavy metal efflux RND transporter [Candidatus Methylomirabilota bacterium]|nr:MAG: CusA/CzcA family heavy metal efflux RND transporter [candidate division NC10 bacterium]
MISRLIEWSATNRFIIGLFTLFAIAWGLWAIGNTPLDAIPDLSDVQVIVQTEWAERSPTLVEDQITYPIVVALLSAPKVKVVRGFSFFGISFVYVIFQDGTDLYWARTRVLEYMQGVQDRLPDGATPILGPDATGVGWGFEYALVDETGRHDLAQLRTLNDWYVHHWLLSVPGVAEVARVGGFVKQYQVTIDPATLLGFKLHLERVIEAIRKGNNDTGGRVVEFTGREYMVRGLGYIKSIKDVEAIVVGTDERGIPILVRDIGRVGLGPDIRRGVADLNGQGDVAGGIVVIRYGENALDVIQRIKDKIRQITPSLPEGVRIVTTYDRSDLIHRSIATLKEKLLEESLIVSVVSILFLFHFRSALVAILTLPIAILMSFVAMNYIGLGSNIMSLGGIAIAIGAMIDAAIVMIENAHKRLEHAAPGDDRNRIIIEAAKEVGKPLFYSLLIITVSFIPVFTLQAQEGRLFRPLAFTKTFAMFFSSLLSVTLVPLLMILLIRGKIHPEHKNPISRFLIWVYNPIVHAVLKWRKTTIAVAVLSLLLTIPVFMRLGSEFMPPLYEGTLLYMPVTLPGASITQVSQLLQIQDRIIKHFPEVESVFAKGGRATSATDPAPLEMIETVINLKPEEEWRKGLTVERLIDELDNALQIPGVTNAWTMPIKARTDMLSTGIRTPVGIKVLGTKLEMIQRIGQEIETALKPVRGTRSVFAERTAGGYYLDFKIKRDEIARYGLTVTDVEDVIETAIGGSTVTTTIEGRERFPVNVRYFRGLRDSLDDLRRVLVSTPMGPQIPITQLVDLKLSSGTTLIRSEDAELVGYVYVDVVGRDIGGYVAEAQRVVAEKVELPSGYHLIWSGQFEYMERAKERLKYVIPLTLLIIFVLLYFNFGSLAKCLIVLLSVPFALVGGIWLLYLLGYNLSVAVWVGIIALGGVAAETGVVMIVYLDEVYERRAREGKMTGARDLYEAIIEGAVMRVRPKMMTVMAIMAGLLPIMWSHGAGADVMKRIAAPMIGGMVTSTILTLVIIPVIYEMWRSRQLPQPGAPPTVHGEGER